MAHGNGIIAGCFLAGGVGLLAEVVFYDGHGCKRLNLRVRRNLAGNRFSKAGSSSYLRIRPSVHGRGAVASRPWGERVLGAGRSNRGRGAMTIKEEGTTFCAFRNNF